MNSITRRRLLRTGVALAGSAAAVKAAKKEEKKEEKNEPLLLECKWIEKTIDGVRVKLRSYNGQVPGQLIKACGGDTLRIRVKNSLPPVDSAGWDGMCRTCSIRRTCIFTGLTSYRTCLSRSERATRWRK
jgi:FtsP/CotA-like multicopper oxidase with cupredoxin domain